MHHLSACACACLHLERNPRVLHMRALSMCHNQGGELFSPVSLMNLASSLGHRTGELCGEGSLALANKHMHMLPLTYLLPSNLHTVMRFFIWYSIERWFSWCMKEHGWILVSPLPLHHHHHLFFKVVSIKVLLWRYWKQGNTGMWLYTLSYIVYVAE